MKLSKFIDHTALKADTKKEQINKLCAEAKEHDFASVCVNSCWVKHCVDQLEDTNVKVCSVVGFPLGAMSTPAKAFEAKQAIADGATEIDMVLNIGNLLDGNYELVREDIKKVKEAIGSNILKVIFEICLLNDEQIKQACKLSLEAGADFVKTSTGFSTGGATFEAVEIMVNETKDKIEVKASGGVRTPDDLDAYIKKGVTRIGTSSGVKLISGKTSDSAY